MRNLVRLPRRSAPPRAPDRGGRVAPSTIAAASAVSLDATLLAALQEEPSHFLNEKWHASGALGHTIDHFLRQRVAGGNLSNHVPHLLAVERGE